MVLIVNEMAFNKFAYTLSIILLGSRYVFNHWIACAAKGDNLLDGVKRVDMYKTSSSKRHCYIMLCADPDKNRMIHIHLRRAGATVVEIEGTLTDGDVDAAIAEQFVIYMSPSYIFVVIEHWHNASIALDILNIVAKPSETFDQVWNIEDNQDTVDFLAYWCGTVLEADIAPFMKFLTTLKTRISGIVNDVKARINSDLMESIKKTIQFAKPGERGYRNNNNIVNVIYHPCRQA